jgi:restriction system protein
VGGFKRSLDKEEGMPFFRVLLWNADDVVDAIVAEYDRLQESLRASSLLKRGLGRGARGR